MASGGEGFCEVRRRGSHVDGDGVCKKIETMVNITSR
jgi:predicted RNA binding protein YcfA (HicA-like mRNA interferase family)